MCPSQDLSGCVIERIGGRNNRSRTPTVDGFTACGARGSCESGANCWSGSHHVAVVLDKSCGHDARFTWRFRELLDLAKGLLY
jgi:hypothetical protein